MTVQELQNKVADLAEHISSLEREACDHEQKARDKRAERAVKKLELTELRQQLHNAGTQAAANQAVDAAKKAQSQAEANSQQLAAELKQVQNLREELEKQVKPSDGDS